jgi:hypothetical protein
MKHFKREALIQAAIPMAIVLLGLMLMFTVQVLITFVESDKCMDAGGAYDYSAGVCMEPRQETK